jgi:hypothetical protein
MCGHHGSRVALWLFCVGSLLQVACDKTTSPPRTFIAILPVPIASMSPQQWNSLATRLDQNDNPLSGARLVNRDCTGCPNNLMTVQIAAVTDARFMGSSFTPSNGAVAVRIMPTTTSNGTENKYGYQDGQFAYLLVVTPPSGGATYGRWTLVKLSWTLVSNVRQYTFVGTVVSGTLTNCNHPKKAVSDATFATCATAPAVRAALTSADVSQSLRSQLVDPVWLSCLAGCCTAEL